METIHYIFFNDAGRLRSGWRLAIFVGIYLVLMFIATGGVRVVYALQQYIAPNLTVLGEHFSDLVFRVVLLVTSLGAGYICARLLEGLPWRSLGLTLHARWLRDLIVGSVIGIVSLAIATAIAFVAGGLRFSLSVAGVKAVALTLVFSALLFIVAALAEEALFRGYPLQTLTRARLIWLGILLTSVPFAAIHLKNPNGGGMLAFVNTALAGVWLAAAYLKTRSLWFPLGVHWAWNWALGSLFGLPVSGITKIAPYPILVGSDLGPAWLTGAAYGIEGGVACTIALMISTIFIWKTGLVSATPELIRMTSNENPLTPPATNTTAVDPRTIAEAS
jgi:membrane protease YdiL (CAAX protease family)